ncbi:MAG: hypothetical protein AAFR81_16685 [Chloroflexota bacterium]
MVTLKRIGIISAGRVGFWMGVALSVTQLIFLLFFLTIIADISLTDLPFLFWQQMFIGLLFSGAITAFSVGMYAFIYNMNANRFGGLELEFEVMDTPSEPKRKNSVPPAPAGDEETTVV